MAPTTTVSTPLPAGLSPETVINTLHSHELYIKATCPQLVKYNLVEGDPATKATYEVTDKKPIGETTYKLTLANVPDGVDTLVDGKMPMGSMKIAGQWRVVDGSLKEEVEIDANMVVKKIVKGNVEKSHPEHHVTLFTEAQKA
jgi:hypothetical protein